MNEGSRLGCSPSMTMTLLLKATIRKHPSFALLNFLLVLYKSAATDVTIIWLDSEEGWGGQWKILSAHEKRHFQVCLCTTALLLLPRTSIWPLLSLLQNACRQSVYLQSIQRYLQPIFTFIHFSRSWNWNLEETNVTTNEALVIWI